MGAATAIRTTVDEDGDAKVAAADEKFQSVWRATCRRAAEAGGPARLG